MAGRAGTWLTADGGSALFDGKPARRARIARTNALAPIDDSTRTRTKGGQVNTVAGAVYRRLTATLSGRATEVVRKGGLAGTDWETKEEYKPAWPASAIESAETAPASPIVDEYSNEYAPSSGVVGRESSAGRRRGGKDYSLQAAAFLAALIVGGIVALAIFVAPVVFADMLHSYQEALRSTSA